MKRGALLVLMCLVFSVTVVSVEASAGAGKRRVYEGTLSNGYPMEIKLVLREDRPPALREVEFGADITCDDGTLQTWFIGFGWGGGLPAMPAHALDLDLVDSSQAIHLHGKVQAVHGAGTMQFTIATLTMDEQAQLCTTGELTWTVDRTVPPVESPPPVPLEVVRYVTGDGVRVTLTRLR
jgi:hypothetical protein